MPINSNIGATVPATNVDPVGLDNPGEQDCPNCRKTVQPHAVNGIGQRQGNGKAAGVPTSAGYACPSCGHNFNWVKSTGKEAGPVITDSNLPTAADM
jgi:hypothetical protein